MDRIVDWLADREIQPGVDAEADRRLAALRGPAPEEKLLLRAGGPITEAKRAITVLLTFNDIHEDEKRGLRQAASLLGIDCEPEPAPEEKP